MQWATLWTIANVTSVIGAIVELVDIGREEAKLIAQRLVAKNSAQSALSKQIDSTDKNSQTQQNLDTIRLMLQKVQEKKLVQILTIIKTLGDTITSTNLMGLPKKYLGFEFNDGLIGAGGSVSAAITIWQTYPSGNK